MPNLEFIHEFDELGLINFRDSSGKSHEPWVFATGRAHIEYDRALDDWFITGIQLKQGLQRNNEPFAWLSPADDAAIYSLIKTALEQQCSDAIRESIAEQTVVPGYDDRAVKRAVVLDQTR